MAAWEGGEAEWYGEDEEVRPPDTPSVFGVMMQFDQAGRRVFFSYTGV